MTRLLEGLYFRAFDKAYITPEFNNIPARIAEVVKRFFSNTTENYQRTPGCRNTPYPGMVAALCNMGFRVLGSGNFAVVLEHTDHPGLAFKVGLKKEDSGATYAAWCRANVGKYEHIPRILYLQRYEECYVAVMPKYKPYDYSCYDIVRIAREALHGAEYGEDELDAACCFGVYVTITAIREFFQGLASFDLHDENVMLDDEGKLVITDPVSFTGDRLIGEDGCATITLEGIR